MTSVSYGKVDRVAAGRARVVAEQGVDAREHLGLRRRVCGGDEAHRCDPVEHAVAGKDLRLAELDAVPRLEQRASSQRGTPPLVPDLRLVAGEGPDAIAHSLDPWHRLVAPVPRQHESAAGAEDAVDLGQGADGVEPVERLRGDDRVDRARGQGDRLGRPVDDLDARRAAARRRELRAHARDGLEGDDPCAGRHEERRQLAGPGAELEHRPSRPEVEPLDDRGHGVLGVAGPGAVVQVGGPVEAASRGRMDRVGHADDPRAAPRTRRPGPRRSARRASPTRR